LFVVLEAEEQMRSDSANKFVSFMSFVMSAFVCSPNTSGGDIMGKLSLMYAITYALVSI